MPKIIENLQDKLLMEARRQTKEQGYAATTIRSVAKAVGVGVGTVYNYFPSKDALIAGFMLSDWQLCLDRIQTVSGMSTDPEPVLRCIFQCLTSFVQEHWAVLGDQAASSAFSGSFSHYHGVLRDQVSQPLRKFCTDDFAAQFIGEAMLTWTVGGKPFEEIFGQIQKLF